jgi:hypothetical protein
LQSPVLIDQAYTQDDTMLSISTNFSASSDAYMDLLQKQMETARNNAQAIDQISNRVDQDQKSLARQRVEEIKKQIEALRKMLALFGGKDAKAVLQQLKQLANQLKQAAGVLRTSSDAGIPDINAMPAEDGAASATVDTEAADGYEEGRQAYAEQQASAEAEASSLAMLGASQSAQSAEDARQLEAASQALKSLRSALERIVKKQDALR